MALLPPPPANVPPTPRPTAVEMVYRDLRPPASLREYDNYVVQNTFSHSEGFCSELSIDFVKTFVPVSLANSVYVLKSLCFLGCPHNLLGIGKGFFYFVCNMEKFGIYFESVSKNGHYQGYSVKIFGPNHSALCQLDAAFFGICLISEIEFSVDLYSNNPAPLFTLIRSTLTVPWPGLKFVHTYQTCYPGNIRKNRSKGARAYVKEINGEVAVRLELVLKRKLIRKLPGVSLTTLNQIRAENVFEKLRFMQLKTNTIRKKYRKVFLKIFNGDIVDLKLSTYFFRSVIRSEFFMGLRGVLEFISKLLGKGVYSEVHPFQERFMKSIQGRSFFS